MGGTVPQHNISMDPLKQSGKNRRRCQIKREQGNKDEPPKLHTDLPASMTFQQLLERIVSIFRISRLYAEYILKSVGNKYLKILICGGGIE